MDQEQTNLKKNRLTLLMLLLVFLVPALGSWLLYANRANVHLGTTNRGQFVQPARLMDVTGLGLPSDYFAHHQTLVYVRDSTCDVECSHTLDVMQAAQFALGEQSGEVQRLYLAASVAAADATGDRGLTIKDATGKPVLKAFDADASQYIYLVDPNGYVVLRYPLSQDPKSILIDLRHLLGISEG
jgi:cytochrome oxidase Cu insertion factor (SCO1/SenC/PrrC family)